MKKKPIIIDCDTGTDDAIALVAAFGSENADLIAITSVTGNVDEAYTSENNLNLTAYCGRKVPVAHGACRPLNAGHYQDASYAHGKSGLGTVTLPQSSESFDPRIAPTLIYEEAKRLKGELELVVTGPMTNIAIALMEHEDLPDLIHHIWFMGGAVHGGNTTSTSEFNVWVDPEALHAVLMSGIDITMVGLDVTEQAYMRDEDVSVLRSFHTKEADLCADIIDYMNHGRAISKRYRACMHDSLALAAALDPECLVCHDHYVDVDVFSDLTRGTTVVDLFGKTGRKPNVSVAEEVDVDQFRTWLTECIRRAGEKHEQ